MESCTRVARSEYFPEAYETLGSRPELETVIERILAVHGRLRFHYDRIKGDKSWYQWIAKSDLLQRDNKTISSFLENVAKVDKAAAASFILCYTDDYSVFDLFAHKEILFNAAFEERWLIELFERKEDLKATLDAGDRETLLPLVRQAKSLAEFYFFYRYGEKTLSQVQSISLEDCRRSWQNHVVHNDRFIESSDYGLTKQQRYGAMMEKSIREGVAFLDDFDKLLDYLAYCRHQIGWELSCEKSRLCFGLPMDLMQSDLRQFEGRNFYPTYCRTSYRELGDFLEDIASEWLEEKPQFFRKAEPEDEDATYQMWVGDIPHSALRVRWYDTTIIHTRDPAVRRRMLQKARELFQNSDLESLGQVYWWVCQAKPWNRGDPSIAEMLIKTKLYSEGRTIHPWKQGVIPWVEVMKEPDPVAFGRKFHTLLEEV